MQIYYVLILEYFNSHKKLFKVANLVYPTLTLVTG